MTFEELASKEPSQGTAKMALTTTLTASLIATIRAAPLRRYAVTERSSISHGVDCDDRNECTADTCDPVDGECNHANVTDGTPCDLGGLPGVCGVGVCEDAMLCVGVDCDDQNECTDDVCDPMDGQCDHTNVMDGTACDFGGLPGVCAVGVCEDAMLCAGVNCDDANECTDDVATPWTGSATTPM